MKSLLGVALLASSALAGCHTAPPVTLQTLVGSYVYKSNDPEDRPTDHQWDHLTLQADGKYDLVQGGPTKPEFEKKGFWSFRGGDDAQVMLDHAGYPVDIADGEVRLMIDYDTGIWYAKSK